MKVITFDCLQYFYNRLKSVISDATKIFTGATDSADGTAGSVPVPQKGDQIKFLKGDGTWSAVQSGLTKVVYTAPGTYIWTCPAGVTMVLATIIGAGGGGEGGTWLGSMYGGGGGNVIRDYPMAVTPGTNYTITVGAGGTGSAKKTGSTQFADSAADGGASSFNSLTAAGGKGAYFDNNAHVSYNGKGALILSHGTTLNDGSGQYGGGQFGGLPATASDNSKSNGGIGSGGGGGYGGSNESTRTNGGNGGQGMVLITY